MTTVREIAEFAGVSTSTVSLVLNEKPGVSDRMRQQVLHAVQELEARHALVADNDDAPMRAGSGSYAPETQVSIMVLHPPVLRSSYVFSRVLQGIQAAAAIYQVQIRLVANDRQMTDQHVAYLSLSDENLRPDGVLVFGAQRHEPLVDHLEEARIPCVVLGREANKYNISGLERDEARYSRQLTRHLLEIGHRQIGFVGYNDLYDFARNRLAGYRQALREAGIAIPDSWIQAGDGASATRCLLETVPGVTALIFLNDSCAEEGLPVLEQKQIAIPNDLSVASFDDTVTAQTYVPALTSVSYDFYREGQWAVKILLDQIRYPFLERVQIRFKAELVLRGSTAPPA